MSSFRSDLELIDEAINSLYRLIWREIGNGEEPEEDKLRSEIPAAITQLNIVEALGVCRAFRNQRCHYMFDLIDFFSLACSISTLVLWMSDRVSDSELLSIRLASSLCRRLSRSIDSSSPTEASSSAISNDIDGLTLAEIKKTHKQEIKGSRIQIMDGDSANLRGTFGHWNGTVVVVYLDDIGKRVIRIKTRVKVLEWKK